MSIDRVPACEHPQWEVISENTIPWKMDHLNIFGVRVKDERVGLFKIRYQAVYDTFREAIPTKGVVTELYSSNAQRKTRLREPLGSYKLQRKRLKESTNS